MKETNLRKWHRFLGVILAIFIVVQAGSGLVISTQQLGAGHSHEHGHEHPDAYHSSNVNQRGAAWNLVTGYIGGAAATIHHGGGLLGSFYRILLATGILLQTILGLLIFRRIRSRASNGQEKA